MSRRREGERGTAILEMALLLPVLLLVVLGTIDFGRAVYVHNALANAARDGARFASVDPTNTTCIKTLAERNSSLANLGNSDVTVTRGGSLDLGQPVTVAVQSTYQPLSSLLAGAIGVNTITLRASATMEIRQIPASSLACP